MTAARSFYSCERCPSYCCSYPNIAVGVRDLRRLAKHLGIDVETARETLTKQGDKTYEGDLKGGRVMRHQRDEHFGTACRFLDTETRTCTIYEARPAICRNYPGTTRCGYYDFLSAERKALKDPDYIAGTYNRQEPDE